MTKNFFTLSHFTLFIALLISTVAAYYSIVGLTAIFAAAVIPIIIMGTILEVGKITTTVWLRKYWHRCGLFLKTYLTIAVVILAILTSMGIFGFLSKAHSDQSLISGDTLAKLSVFDEKIKVSKENIEVNRKALKQLDEAVDQVMARSTSEAGADKAVQMRRTQNKERSRLLQEIETEQKKINEINELRAPIAAEVRKVEAEVGPLKYIAALIYGDNLDTNLLEKAVRWVIIIIVLVFDPLAIALVLAANNSKIWDIEDRNAPKPEISAEMISTPPIVEPEVLTETPKEEILVAAKTLKHPPDIELAEPQLNDEEEKVDAPNIIEEMKVESVPEKLEPNIIKVSGVTKLKPYTIINGDYVLYDGKSMAKNALKELKPELFLEMENDINNFGTKFPRYATMNETFIRTDLMPTKVFKFDGKTWIETDKIKGILSDDYIKFLISKIDCGDYDINILSDSEKTLIQEYLSKT